MMSPWQSPQLGAEEAIDGYWIHYGKARKGSWNIVPCSYQEVLSHIEQFFIVKDSGSIVTSKHRSLMGTEYHYYYILETRS